MSIDCVEQSINHKPGVVLMLRQYELVDLVKSYDPHADEDMLNRAYVFAMRAHGRQTRHSGDPYFSHPIEVAGILTQLKLDTPTIVTALLHDTIEDTAITRADIVDAFGEEIGDLVDGVTKLSNIQFSSRQAKQAENFRKFFLATSKDVRVLLVKLADRLHNMRTIQFVPSEEKRRAIAEETLEIYAPLAGRIGMQGFREEYEDRAFATLNPEGRTSVIKRLDFLREESDTAIGKITEEIKQQLRQSNIDAAVFGRLKRPYSVWRKMERKDISFEQLSDIIGFRVIVDTVPECYSALGVIHSKWQMVPHEFDDYISTPKRNGYQSIHTTVIGPDKKRVELQIRTKGMHEIAETGVAAHWDYKERAYTIGDDRISGGDGGDSADGSNRLLDRLFSDLQGLAKLLNEEENSEIFLENTKMEMFSDQVFVFTPKGDLINLPRGATAIDFAYAVHTRIGDTCVGAKINGHHRTLRTPLRSGDSVEILCSRAQLPTPDWEENVVTGRARSAIRRRVKQIRRDEFIELGRSMLRAAFSPHDIQATTAVLTEAAEILGFETTDALLASVGEGSTPRTTVVESLFPPEVGASEKSGFRRLVLPLNLFRSSRKSANQTPGSLPIQGIKPGLAITLAGCCHPIPGDRIVGIRNDERGVDVHTIDCAAIAGAQDKQWLDLTWERDLGDASAAVGRIMMYVPNQPGVLGEISTIIASQDGNITNVRFVSQDTRSAQLEVDIAVSDVRHLESIIGALRGSSLVASVERSRGQDVAMVS